MEPEGSSLCHGTLLSVYPKLVQQSSYPYNLFSK
jgi:hypothetical protein